MKKYKLHGSIGFLTYNIRSNRYLKTDYKLWDDIWDNTLKKLAYNLQDTYHLESNIDRKIKKCII